MTEMKLPTPANDNQSPQSIAQEQVSAKGGVLSVILGLGKFPFEAMGIIERKPFNPEELYKAVNQERRRVIQALEQSHQEEVWGEINDSISPDELKKAV